jgi:hypothetical protein
MIATDRTRPARFYVYDNWSAYDELSDAVPLTEELALFQLAQVKRLMAEGVKYDAYLMDAYWYDPDGAYMTWREDRWPSGPDRWLEECKVAGLLPGLWFPANTLFTLTCPLAWRDSLASDHWGFCCFEGGFLSGFLDVLRHWYLKGVRVFKFDFAEFGAASDATKAELSFEEIRSRNIAAYRAALTGFRQECPEAWLLAYNGFENEEFMPWTDRAVGQVMDPEWLEVFDSIYCGDPRPADLPQTNFWRSLDIYADHEVRVLNLSGLPLSRIDNCALMLGKTDTCYKRGSESWRTTWLLSYARGGRVHVTMGNLEAISDEDAQWIAQVQKLYETNLETEWLGGLPGAGEIYGYCSGGVRTWVNPGLETACVHDMANIWFDDGAYQILTGKINLGAGGVAVTDTNYGLVRVPMTLFNPGLMPVHKAWSNNGRQANLTLRAKGGRVHFGFQQFDQEGHAVRTTTGSGPDTPGLGSMLLLTATATGEELEVEIQYDRAIWSGLSWAYGIVETPRPMTLTLTAESKDPTVHSIRPFAYHEL